MISFSQLLILFIIFILLFGDVKQIFHKIVLVFVNIKKIFDKKLSPEKEKEKKN